MSSAKDFYTEILKLENLSDPYQRNYFYGHLGQLNKVFVVTRSILGEDNFNFFANLYVRSLNSTEPNMDSYGRSFPEFLSKREELEQMPYLRGLASIDFFWYEMPEKGIRVEKGMLHFWGLVANGEDLSSVEIDGENTELISIVQEGAEFSLRASL